MAKKKIKDLTIEEADKICNKYSKENCNNCPCLMIPANYKEYSVCAFDLDEFDYEIEVEE